MIFHQRPPSFHSDKSERLFAEAAQGSNDCSWVNIKDRDGFEICCFFLNDWEYCLRLAEAINSAREEKKLDWEKFTDEDARIDAAYEELQNNLWRL